jgi:carboxymethylenebutenolidase
VNNTPVWLTLATADGPMRAPGIAAGPHAVLDRAESLDAPVLLHVYPGAGHAFACDARPRLYDADAASAAWERTWSFLDRRLPAS